MTLRRGKFKVCISKYLLGKSLGDAPWIPAGYIEVSTEAFSRAVCPSFWPVPRKDGPAVQEFSERPFQRLLVAKSRR